jgi:hypothetical protein
LNRRSSATWRRDDDQHSVACLAEWRCGTCSEGVVHRLRAPFSAAKRLGSRSLVSYAVVHEQPRRAVWNFAERLR